MQNVIIIGMNYIFDFFGVISSEVANTWFSKHLPGHDIPELRRQYVVDADLGRISTSDYFKKLAELSQQEEKTVAKQLFKLAQIDEQVVSIIKKLKESHRVALCSNAPADYIRPILQKNNLDQLFDLIVISGEVRMVKPNDDIFLHTLKLLKVKAEEALFIDDSEQNVSAASKLGMQTILFRDIKDIQGLVGKG